MKIMVRLEDNEIIALRAAIQEMYWRYGDCRPARVLEKLLIRCEVKTMTPVIELVKPTMESKVTELIR